MSAYYGSQVARDEVYAVHEPKTETPQTQDPNAKERKAIDPSTTNLGDEDLAYSLGSHVGGGMNRLDLVEYKYGIEQTEGGGHEKVEGGQFTGYFKAEQAYDTDWGSHRGSEAGIGLKDPNFHGRAIASYELARFFGTDVIPSTFEATHKGKKGFVIEEVQGKTKNALRSGSDEDKRLLSSPEVQKGLSTLYLLDYIAGQADRHSQNVIISPDGKVSGIDSDIAFGKDIEHRKTRETTKGGIAGVLVGELEVIDREFANRIIAKAKDPKLGALIREALRGLISEPEIEATVERLKRLADALEKLPDDATALHKLSDFEHSTNAEQKEAKFV